MLSLIAAVARNRVIGKDNQLLWHLPEDMKHFREITQGKPVIMGRKTWESLPEKFRPLPGRHNIVVSRNPHYKAPGADLATSLDEAIQRAGHVEEIFVIGGATLYQQALRHSQKLYLTEIDQDYVGDAYFPEVPPNDWQAVSRQAHLSQSGLTFSFITYQRTQST